MNLIVLLLMLPYTFIPLFFNFLHFIISFYSIWGWKIKKIFPNHKAQMKLSGQSFFHSLHCIQCFLFFMINVCRNRHNKEYMAQIRTRNCMAEKEIYSILLHTSLIFPRKKKKIFLGKNENFYYSTYGTEWSWGGKVFVGKIGL